MRRFMLLVVVLTVGFAPAPLPRADRRGQSAEITLGSFQGRWRVVSVMTSRANGQHVPFKWWVTHVRVEGNRWDLLSNDSPVSSRQFSIDVTKKPAHLNLDDGGSKGFGLIRLHDGQVQVLYVWGDEKARAASFDPAPEGHWLITLQRE